MSLLKLIIITLIFVGILFIAISVVKNQEQSQIPQPKIIYRYIPRTFEEEQNEPVYVSDIFRTMFSQPDAWMIGVGALDAHKNAQVNKYFVSQA